MQYLQEFEKLKLETPRCCLVAPSNENSEFINYCGYCKDCYLIYASDYNEDCMHCYFIYHCNDCAECSYCHKCEMCFQCVDCEGCYDCNYCQDCKSCMNCEYSYDCIGCNNCFGCVNLRRKEFYIFNKRYSKEDYVKKIEELKKKSPENLQAKIDEIRATCPRVYSHQIDNEQVSGDYIYNSKNAYLCYDVKKMQDAHYMNNCLDCADSMDCSNIYHKNELCYMCTAATYLYNCNFCYSCFECQDLEYCEQCYNSHDLFLCTNQKHSEYMILNKKYSKEDYFKEKERILNEMKQNGEYGRLLNPTYPYEDSLSETFWPGAPLKDNFQTSSLRKQDSIKTDQVYSTNNTSVLSR